MPGNLGWDPLTPTPAYELASRIGAVLLYAPAILVLILGRKFTQTPSRQTLEFFIILVCSLLTSPIAWTHYFMLLLLPLAWYLADGTRPLQKSWITGVLLFSMVLISVPKDLSLALFEQTELSIFLSAQFVGGVLLYMLLLAVWVLDRKLEESATN